MADPNATPNLASVLATLAAYAPSQPAPPPQHTPLQAGPPSLEDGELSEGEYDPSNFIPTTSPPPKNPQIPPSSFPQNPPISRTPPAPSTASTSAIISWAPALRHTTLLLSRSPAILLRIRHLIGTAHSHEKQWFTGRETLVQKISGREEGRKKLDAALASVGGLVGGVGAGAFTSSDLAANEELALYDRKVHRACREMVNATETELGKLGVPFFGVRGDLVGEGEGKTSQGELRQLQKRMIGFLEEFCGE